MWDPGDVEQFRRTLAQDAYRRPTPADDWVDTASIYLILVAGAAVALVGGTVLRLVGVKLKWTS